MSFILTILMQGLICFHIQPHYHRLIVYTYIKSDRYFNSEGYFKLMQVPISLVILVIGIQDLYTSKYKYTIIIIIIS